MLYTVNIDVVAPKKKVARIFADPQYLGEYQKGFLSKTLLEGKSGQSGAVSKMLYDFRGREMELIETIHDSNLPDDFYASYHHKHMDNTMKVKFTELEGGVTRYDAEFEYTAFRGFFPNIMRLFFPGVLKKQGQEWLDNFKFFVENYEE